MDPDLDPTPNPTPNPTPFFSDFMDGKTIPYYFIFPIAYPQAHYVQSLKPTVDETAQKSQKRIL
jgi:hypothetical protein